MGWIYLIFIEIGVKKTISEFQHPACITLTMLIPDFNDMDLFLNK